MLVLAELFVKELLCDNVDMYIGLDCDVPEEVREEEVVLSVIDKSLGVESVIGEEERLLAKTSESSMPCCCLPKRFSPDELTDGVTGFSFVSSSTSSLSLIRQDSSLGGILPSLSSTRSQKPSLSSTLSFLLGFFLSSILSFVFD